MQSSRVNHYAVLGLDSDCATEQVRAAYRALAKQYHPDLNAGSGAAVAHTQALNLAYETLSDPARRNFYDHELAAEDQARRSRPGPSRPPITKDVRLKLDEFFRGSTREVHVNDPGDSGEDEIYDLIIPPGTAVGTRFRLRRNGGGLIIIRVVALPHFHFKVRGADLRSDLKINFKRAAQGGEDVVIGPTGTRLRVKIPSGAARGEILRLTGEGMPKARGGRGDLLVRLMYQPEVRITRRA